MRHLHLSRLPVRHLAALALLLGGLVAAPLAAADLSVYGSTIAAGTSGTVTLTHAGYARTALIHVPSGFTGTTAVPLVMVIHGGAGASASIETSSGWSAKADAVGCLVVYPQGLSLNSAGVDDPAHEISIWGNDRGTRPDLFATDDAGFITGLIDQIALATPVDSDRVYAMGMSNGGMMVHRLGRDCARYWAAMSSVSGSYTATPTVTPFAPAAPVSMLIFHGTSDSIVPYAGGAVPDQGGPVIGAEATRDLWRGADRTGDAIVTDLPDTIVDGCTSQQLEYPGGDAGTRVILVTITGGSHSWPGSGGAGGGAGAGSKTTDFKATDMAWTFFAAQRRQPEADVARSGSAILSGHADPQPGSTAIGAARDLVYTITNRGSAALALGGLTTASPVGCTADVLVAPPTTLAAGASVAVTLRITPAATAWSAQATLASDDADEGVYAWTVSGMAADGSGGGSSSGGGGSGGGGGCGAGGAMGLLLVGLALVTGLGGRRRGH